MSKSIYDEVLEIIDKNIFELPDGFAVLYEIRKKIQQAKKQEKLLKLYRELINVKDEIISFLFNGSYDDYTDEIAIDLEVQIDELEKQIEELENDK